MLWMWQSFLKNVHDEEAKRMELIKEVEDVKYSKTGTGHYGDGIS